MGPWPESAEGRHVAQRSLVEAVPVRVLLGVTLTCSAPSLTLAGAPVQPLRTFSRDGDGSRSF